MNYLESIKFENDTQFIITFQVNEDGTPNFDKDCWKKVEPKLKTAWSKAIVFDILSKVYINDNGWVHRFTLEVEKKLPSRFYTMKLDEVKVQLIGDDVIAEFGGVVTKNLKDVILDIRAGYLPRVMEEFENSEIKRLEVEVCFKQINWRKCKAEFENAIKELTEVQKKLEEYRKKEEINYGKE